MTALGSSGGRILDANGEEEEHHQLQSNDDSHHPDFIVLQRVLFYQIFSMAEDLFPPWGDTPTDVLRHWCGIFREMLTILFCISLLKHFIRFHVFEQQQQPELRRTSLPSDDEEEDEDEVSESSLELTSTSSLSVSLSEGEESSDREQEEEEVKDEEEEEIDFTSSYGNYSFNSNRVDVSTCYNESDFEAEAVISCEQQQQQQQQQLKQHQREGEADGEAEHRRQASLIGFTPPLNSSKAEDEDERNGFAPRKTEDVDFPSPYTGPEDEDLRDEEDDDSSLYSIDSECSWFQDHYGTILSRERRRKFLEEEEEEDKVKEQANER